MKYANFTVTALVVSFALTGCQPSHQARNAKNRDTEFTLGLVQKEISIGMNQADVASALGSPNMVTKDAEGKETWVYDKIASEASYKNNNVNAGIGGGISGISGTTPLAGILSLGISQNTGSSKTSKKSLTVVIKFMNNKVESFSYHSSKF